jgi:hypothetical protein
MLFKYGIFAFIPIRDSRGRRIALSPHGKFGSNITSIYTNEGTTLKMFGVVNQVPLFDLWKEVDSTEEYSVWVQEDELFWF